MRFFRRCFARLTRRLGDPFRVLLVSVVMIPFCGFAYGGYKGLGQEMDSARHDMNLALELATEQANNAFQLYATTIRQAQALVGPYSDTAQIASDPDKLHRQLQLVMENLPLGRASSAQEILVFGPDGIPVVSAYTPIEGNPWAFLGSGPIENVQRNPTGLYLSRLHLNPATGQQNLSVSQALRRGDRFAGMISILAKPEAFREFWEKLEIVELGGHILLRREDGPLVLRAPASSAHLAPDELAAARTQKSFLEAIAQSPNQGWFQSYPDPASGVRLVAYRRLNLVPAYILVTYPRALVWSTWAGTMAHQLWFGVPAVLAMLLLVWMGHSYSKRMVQMVRDEVHAQEMLGDIVENVTDFAIFRLSPTGEIRSWNAGAERNLGYTADEITGRHFSTFYPPEDVVEYVPSRALAAAQKGDNTTEGWRIRKDGSRFWALTVLSPSFGPNHELTGFTKILRDITDRIENSERMAQAQKMEALGQLTGGVAHDFNNLLTVILGSIELAEVAAAEQPRLLRYITTMRNACTRGAALTQHLLAFSRRQALQPSVLQPRSVLEEAVTMLSKTIRPDITIRSSFSADLDQIKVDASQLLTAVLNVAVNSRDAMPEGGLIEISASNVVLEGQYGLCGSFVAIALKDNGTGIPEADLPKVLEPFFTTKEVGKGSGLGLSQAYGFCRQSGGSLAIVSTVGVGTCVTFYLPVTSERPEHAAEAALAAVTAPSVSTGRILVVEDDPDVASTACEMLEQSGYVVTHAADAAAALDLMQHAGRFDMLFTDVMMPGGMLGSELAQRVHDLYPGTLILLTSGYSDPANNGDAMIWPLLSKPYRAQELINRVGQELQKNSTGQNVS